MSIILWIFSPHWRTCPQHSCSLITYRLFSTKDSFSYSKCIVEDLVDTHFMMSEWTDGFTKQQTIQSISWSVRLRTFLLSTFLLIKSEMGQSAVSRSQSPLTYESQVGCKRRRTTWPQQRMTPIRFTSCQASFYINVSYVWLDGWTMGTCVDASTTDLAVWIPAAGSSLSVFFPDCWLISSSWFQQPSRPSTTPPARPLLCLSRPTSLFFFFLWESVVNSSLELITCERGEKICRFKKGTD